MALPLPRGGLRSDPAPYWSEPNVISPGYLVPTQTPADPDFHPGRPRPYDRPRVFASPVTINDVATMNAQIDAGADGMITGLPDLLRAVMAERGMPLPPAYHKTG